MTLTISERRSAYAAEYLRRWNDAKIDPDKVSTVTAVARLILAGRSRYEEISKATGVPWWWIGLAHNRESDCNFSTHLHNGDPLTARTKLVPAGRPARGNPPFSFFESAVDALTMPGKEYDKIKVWDIVEALLRLEQYNGFGYRGQGIPSPYLWAMTNQTDERGKYVRDGVFDPNAYDRQVGCVAIMLALRGLGVDLFPAAAPPPAPAPVPIPPPDVEPIDAAPQPKPVAQTVVEKPATSATGAGALVVGVGSAAAVAVSAPHNMVDFVVLGAVALVVVAVCIVLLVKHHKGA